MKKHNGMRPQDIVILMKILLTGHDNWLNKDLALDLFISPSEVSESLNRSSFAGLISPSKRKVFKNSLFEFVEGGLKYVFPVRPGELVRGIPTAYAAKPISDMINSTEILVWPDAAGEMKGQSIQPLYEGAVKAAKKDEKLYMVLSLLDALRVGRARESQLAIRELKKLISSTQYEPSA